MKDILNKTLCRWGEAENDALAKP